MTTETQKQTTTVAFSCSRCGLSTSWNPASDPRGVAFSRVYFEHDETCGAAFRAELAAEFEAAKIPDREN